MDTPSSEPVLIATPSADRPAVPTSDQHADQPIDRAERPARQRFSVRVWLDRQNRTWFWRRYGWATLPILVILIFQMDTHTFYGMTWLGQDEPAHTNNVLAIVRTGQMPPPIPAGQMCEKIGTCEGFQPPWFYDLVALTSDLLLNIGQFQEANAVGLGAKITLFFLSLIWFALILYAVQILMPRRAWFAKALIATAAMLIPQVLMIDTMVSNDYGEMILALATLIVLILIVRTERKGKLGWWLLAAALTGGCAAMKLSGVQTIAVYGALAGSIAAGYAIRRRWRQMGKVLLYAGLGVPLIALGLYSTIARALDYLGHELVDSHNVPHEFGWDGDLIAYLTSFQTDIFQYPVYGLSPTQPRETYIPGYTSFWSVQYVGLFSDPLDDWLSPPEFNLPPDQLMINVIDGSNRFQAQSHPLAIIRFAGIQLVMEWAIPIALLMAIGFFATGIRFLWHPRHVLHDGTLVVVLAAGAAFASFLFQTIQYHNRDWFTRPRYALAAYVLLLIVGSAWVQNLWPRHRGLVLPALKLILWAGVLIFCVASYKQYWLASG